MKTYNLALLGFGHVGRALVQLLVRKSDELRAGCGIEWRLTGVSTRRLGWLAEPAGFRPDALLDQAPAASPQHGDLGSPEALRRWLADCRPDVLFEVTSLNPHTGQPAIEHIRAGLEAGAHVVTANKGPVVHAYRELRDLAAARGRHFYFESAVMDGAPIFSLFREALPAVSLLRFRGILNSTTNYILTEMEAGRTFDDAVKQAQAIGMAETDPSADVDGWDAAVKVSALATVLMDLPLKPGDIEREGIRRLTGDMVRAARRDGRPYKLVCRAERDGRAVRATIRPEQVPLSDPMAGVSGTSSLVHFETDVLPGLTITETNPSPETTAYGLLADFINAVR
jgi:homoserine dehydrogenase